jgi:Flp pilus assembly protein TadG
MQRPKRAQSLVEFALVLPLFLMIIFGLIDFSYYLYGWQTIQFAARNGAEQASLLPPKDIRNNYASVLATDQCAALIHERVKGGTTLVTPTDNNINLYWYTVQNMTMQPLAASQQSKNTLDVPNVMVEVRVYHEVAPLTPVAKTLVGSLFKYQAQSRRTIRNINTYVSPDFRC